MRLGRWRAWGEASFLLLLPPLLFFAYSVAPTIQRTGVDPWVYTGYINNFRDLIDRYGLTYYGNRFGLIFPGIAFRTVLGPVAGYFALVLFFYWVALVPLYLAIRKHLGIGAAGLGALTYLGSAWIAHATLWQYPNSAAIAYLVAATSLILLNVDRRRAGIYVLIGALGALAIHSHIFVLTFVGLAVIPYWVMRRGRPWRQAAFDASAAAAGALMVTLGGMAVYWWVSGDWNILAAHLRMIAIREQTFRDYNPGHFAWLWDARWLVYPIAIVACGGLLLGWRRLRRPPLIATVLYAMASCLFFGIYARDGTLVFYKFYVAMLAGAVMPLACLIPGMVVSAARLSSSWLLATAILMGAVPPAAIALGSDVTRVGTTSFLAIMVMAVAAVALSPARRPLAIVACGLLAVASFLPFVSYGVFGDRVGAARDWAQFRLAHRFIEIMPKFASDPQRLLFWYPRAKPGGVRFDSLQATYLWRYSRLHHPAGHGLPDIGPHERATLTSGEAFHLVLLTSNTDELQAGRAALTAEGVEFSSVFEKSLCVESACVVVELLAMHGMRPYWLSGGPDAVPARTLLSASDPSSVVTSLAANLYGANARKARALIVEDGRLVFTPTDRRDHLVTPFFPVGERREDLAAVVRLTTQSPRNAAGACRMIVQTAQYVNLATLPCWRVATESHVGEIVVPKDVKMFRVYFVSQNGRPSDMPSSLRIEVFEMPSAHVR